MPRRIVVIGGGFAGLHVVRGLAREPEAEITLISRTNHTLFQPLLYQVATGSLDEDEVATPIRRVLRRQRNVRFVMAECERLDPPARTVWANGEAFPYDALVLAPGVVYNYFGKEEVWRPLAPSLKTIADAEEIRRRALLSFEKAENERDPAKRSALLNYVLVGGGPTGVEMAGALAELLKESLSRELTMVRKEEVSILLVEASDRVLGQFPEELALASQRRLESLGVTLRLNAKVTTIDDDGVVITDAAGQERVPTENVVWTAGVKGVPLLAGLGVPLDRAGRVPVNGYLEVEGLPGHYVLGDAAVIPGPDGKPLPGVAQVAMQGGDYVARSLRRSLAGREPQAPFKYWDKGNMAVVGRGFAIADLHRLRLKGLVAWFAWLFIHILYLTSFRSRLFVFQRWVAGYLFHNRSAVVFDAPTPLAPVTKPQADEPELAI